MIIRCTKVANFSKMTIFCCEIGEKFPFLQVLNKVEINQLKLKHYVQKIYPYLNAFSRNWLCFSAIAAL